MDFVLEKFTAQDFEHYFQLVSDSKVMEMITERSIPRNEALDDFEQLLASNRIHPELGQFKILDAQTNRFIGLAKLAVADIDDNTAELGYMILPAYWGQGIASRIACLLIEKAQVLSMLQSLFAIIDPGNLASRKILINNQFTSREFKDFDGLPGEVLERIW